MSEKIGIIGVGRLGFSLALALREAGLSVIAVYDKKNVQAVKCAEICGDETKVYDIEKLPRELSVLFLTVPDDMISGIVQQLENNNFSETLIIAHTSGSLSSDVLMPLNKITKYLASMHPVQTFSGSDDDWKRLYGIYFSLEGNKYALSRLTKIIEKFGSKVFILPAGKKAVYHLACVVASNYLVGLEAIAIQIMQKVGLSQSESFQLLEPLVESSLNNIRRNGPIHALTGPITRGDVGTIRNHIEVLKTEFPDFLQIYLDIGYLLIQLTKEQKKSDMSRVNSIKLFFDDLQKLLDQQE